MTNHRKALVLATAALLAACTDASPPTSPSESTSVVPAEKPAGTGITVTDLDLAGARSDSRAEDIDDQGRIVGSRGPWTGPLRAFLWTPTSPRGTTGSAMDLGDLGGGAAQAQGINGSGQVVGSSTTLPGNPNSLHPFLWEAGAMHDLGVPAGSDFVQAMDVNDATPRRVVGGPANPVDRAAVWTLSGSGSSLSATVVVLQGISTEGSFAFALNDAGTVVGYSKAADGTNQPAIWTDAPTWTPHALALLPNASNGIAYDINSAGMVAGFVRLGTAGCVSRAVAWTSATSPATQLPMLSGGTCAEAWAINDAGQISGFSTERRGRIRAVLWRPLTEGDYSVTDLGQLRGTTPQVLGMNEPVGTGVELVGFGRSGNGAEHATLWTVR